jgi:uncharacterized NAD-dependent epimerase/dehydratase family protein
MTHLRDFPEVPVPPLDRVIALYENVASAAGAFPPAPVSAVALDTRGLNDDEAQMEIAAVRASTDLACTDLVRFGSESLLDGNYSALIVL